VSWRQRYQAVLLVIRDGVPVIEVAGRFGVAQGGTRIGRLVHEATRERLDPVPSRSGVHRALKRAPLIDSGARRRHRRFRREERAGATELGQMDVVGGVGLADGTQAL
jgi:hypothetical protein